MGDILVQGNTRFARESMRGGNVQSIPNYYDTGCKLFLRMRCKCIHLSPRLCSIIKGISLALHVHYLQHFCKLVYMPKMERSEPKMDSSEPKVERSDKLSSTESPSFLGPGETYGVDLSQVTTRQIEEVITRYEKEFKSIVTCRFKVSLFLLLVALVIGILIAITFAIVLP